MVSEELKAIIDTLKNQGRQTESDMDFFEPATLSHSNSNTKTYNHIIKHFHRYTAFFYHSGACQGICSKC